MKVFEMPVREGSVATLVGYLHDLSPEMPHRDTRPAMLVFPGGGYHFCSDREGEPIALEWFRRGYNAFVMRYTLIGEQQPAPLYLLPLTDAAATVALLRAHAADWHIDPARIAVIGFSAGAHLTASLATHWDDARLGVQNARPDAIVLGYPVISTRPEAGGWSADCAACLCAGEEEWLHYFATEECVRADMPPAFVWTTCTDSLVDMRHSLRLISAMHAQQLRCELHVFDRGEHGYALANGETWAPTLPVDTHIADWTRLAGRWLDDVFGWTE